MSKSTKNSPLNGHSTAIRNQNPSLAGPLPLVIPHLHEDLAHLMRGLGAKLEPLPCSKGPGCEMIQVFRPERVSASRLGDVFVWGLDVT